MSCDRCGHPGRGHAKGCDAATPTGRRSPQRGRGRRLGPKDIPKHRCIPEVEATRRVPHFTYVEKITFYRCKTCHVSMGKSKDKESKL